MAEANVKTNKKPFFSRLLKMQSRLFSVWAMSLWKRIMSPLFAFGMILSIICSQFSPRQSSVSPFDTKIRML